jgi:hypothetical protein
MTTSSFSTPHQTYRAVRAPRIVNKLDVLVVYVPFFLQRVRQAMRSAFSARAGPILPVDNTTLDAHDDDADVPPMLIEVRQCVCFIGFVSGRAPRGDVWEVRGGGSRNARRVGSDVL